MVVNCIPFENQRLHVSLTSGELAPEIFKQYAPYLADYDMRFIEYVTFNIHQDFRKPFIYNKHTASQEINFFVTEFFDLYPEMKVSMFYFGGIDGVKLENRGIYKLLSRLFKEFQNLQKRGIKQDKALEMTFQRYDDYVKLKMEEVASTQVIAKSLRVRPLLNALQMESMDITKNRLSRIDRDIELSKMKEQINEMDDFEASVGLRIE